MVRIKLIAMPYERCARPYIKTHQLALTAKHIATAQLDWNPHAQRCLWLRGEYRGKSPRFNEVPAANSANRAIYDVLGDQTKAYGLLHLGGSYELSKRVTLSANVYNLLDKDFRQYRLINANGTPTQINQHFQGGAWIAGTTPPGRTRWFTANVKL